MFASFSEVYPRAPMPLTTEALDRFPFYYDSRQEFFEKSWEEGVFEEGSVTMLIAPRMFGKTSFLNMLPRFLEQKGDSRVICSYSCMDSKQLSKVRVVVDEMLKGGENRILILDEMNYAVERQRLWRKIVELAGNISSLKGRRQTILLTTSETSSKTVKEAFDVLHPGTSRLPALSESQTKNVALEVLRIVTGKKKISSKLLNLIWMMSGGIPPYIRITLLHALRSVREGIVGPELLTACMFDFFDNLDAINSCVQTLTKCPIETARMSEKDLALTADQFCLSCPIKCRAPSVKQPVVETDLAWRYGLVLPSNAIVSPIAFYYNDYLGRKKFAEFSSDIINRGEAIQTCVDVYGRKEFVNDILVLLEIAVLDPSLLYEEFNARRLVEAFRSKAELIFLENIPSVNTLSSWKRGFEGICTSTVHGDEGIDLEIHNLKLSTDAPAINSYVQCKNWKTRIELKEVGIFHKFEMVLRTAKQIHAAILISTSEIDEAMMAEAKALTAENKTVFCCWSEPELTTIVSAACGKDKMVHAAITNLSRTKLPTKVKGGALEYLTLKTFSILAERVTRR